MEKQGNSAPPLSDNRLLPAAPRTDAPSVSGVTPSASNEVDEIRALAARTAALESLITSFIATLQTKPTAQVTAAPPDQPPIHDPRDSELPPRRSTSPFRESFNTRSSAITKSTIRDALELVPKFDGHNISIFQFARGCKRARELIPATEERDLARFLRGKLAGHAYLVIEDETHDTVDQILDSLKRTFSPGRTSNFYRGQLSILRKDPNEHILDFIGRVKDLRSAIIECDQATHGRDLTKREILAIDADVIESFFEGLPASYRAEIRVSECGTPTEAYNKAVIVARRLERDLIHSREIQAGQSLRTQLHDPRSYPSAPRITGTAVREPPPVTILQRDPNTPPAFNARAPRTYNNPFPNTRKICGYCQKFGHLMSECRQRQPNSNNAYSQDQGNAPAASANENRGRQNRQTAFSLQEDPLPSTSSNPLPEESRPLN